MKAMMLSAGFGERMQPLTAELPKPAVPVLGRPLAVQVTRWLAGAAHDGIVLNVHHLPDVLVDLLGDGSDFGLPPIAYSRETTLLGTAVFYSSNGQSAAGQRCGSAKATWRGPTAIILTG